MDTHEESAIKSAVESVGEAAPSTTAAAADATEVSEVRETNNGNGDFQRDNRRSLGFDRRNNRAPRPNVNLTPSNNVYVGNLLFDITPADLEREFAQFGTIKSVKIATDGRGLSKG